MEFLDSVALNDLVLLKSPLSALKKIQSKEKWFFKENLYTIHTKRGRKQKASRQKQ